MDLLIEAAPAIVLGVICPLLLRDSPRDAAWHDRRGKALADRDVGHRTQRGGRAGSKVSMWRTMCDPRIVMMMVAGFSESASASMPTSFSCR